MKTTKDFKRFLSELTLGVFMVTTINPVPALAAINSDKVIYPLKEISKLDCRFNDFIDLSSGCKQDLPILKTKDYKKYATKDGGYNDYTRIYTMLWGASYKYGWDIGNGGHIGTDIATSKGTPVYSMADGKVIQAKNDISLGNFVSIEHTIKGKLIISNYAHLSKIGVRVGDRVNVGEKIGEVGSTGNSTGNHLHFQIDLPAPFHPYYYDYNKCPFSYYNLSENGVCRNELIKNTIDPLLFLETEGAVLDNITTRTVSTTVSNVTNNEDLSIFNRTVYIGYSVSDIKKVQEIFQKIGIYRGTISGNYNDIENTIIAYQLSNKLIKDKSEYGAGRFGPKTRYTAKKDYLEYLANGTTSTQVEIVNEIKIDTQKIERETLMSREEIEKREVENFLRYHNVELNFVNEGGNIKKGTTETLKLKVTDRKGKAFKGEMPGGMTFVVDQAKVSVFPERLYYFTDGKRDIKLSGISEGNTNLYVKIGTQVIKTIPLKVFVSGKTIYPDSSKILSPSKITLGDQQTGIVLFKDSNGKSLINLEYGSTFNIKASGDNQICIKEGNISNIKKIYTTSSCDEEDYKNEFNFTYSNTVGGLLIFDYKATSSDLNIKVTNNYNNQVLSEKRVLVSNPKGLNKSYVYTNDVMDMLEAGVVDGINSGYFLENRGLTQRDAFTWTLNALHKMKGDVYDNETKQKIENNIVKVEQGLPYSSRTKVITRKDFLDLTNTYLVLDNRNTGKVEYRDIDNESSEKLSKVFDKNTTWKDQFGEKYFRPEAKITRGEGAFFISKTLEKIAQTYLTLR
ncbi:MAG: M23 family metallopeptidase [Candidatus Gracilibacteria bacterium]